MPRRGSRKRLARGLSEDATGRSAIVTVGEHRVERRFPPHTPLSEMRDWQDGQRRKWKGSGLTAAPRGTLADAVDRWEPLEQHVASWKTRRAELRAWVKELGKMRLTAIRDEHVRRVIGKWTLAGIAPKTIKQRLWTLGHLYRVLHGPDTPTPVDHIDPPTIPRTVIVPTPIGIIMTVYRNLLKMEAAAKHRPGKGLSILRDAKTRARFMVRASTGRRPAEIMRAEPDDVDLDARTWRVRDAKGGWSEGIYLNDDMIEAWRVFIEADAWGPFETSSMAIVLRNAGWPEGVRPYNLRHTVGIELSERGTDLADVSGWLGHTRVQTTRSAYVPILGSRMQRASERLEGRLGLWDVPRTVPRSKDGTGRKLQKQNDRAVRSKPVRKRQKPQ